MRNLKKKKLCLLKNKKLRNKIQLSSTYFSALATYSEVFECPKCHSKNIKWYLSSTKQCKNCECVFRAENIVEKG